MDIAGFNIRIYGVYINKGQLLLTDEFRLGMPMTKFPGGGLIPGEGTIDCLKREFMEEMGQEIEILRHYYTTDFFQPSYHLNPPLQLISIYYRIDFVGPFNFTVKEKPFDYGRELDGAQSFRFLPLEMLNEKDLSFPVDKRVALMLKQDYFAGTI